MAGILANCSDFNCFPSPNQNGFELFLKRIQDCSPVGKLFKYSSYQIFLHTVLLAPESNMALHQVLDNKT